MLTADGKSIYTSADDLGQHPLFKVDIASGKVSQLVGEGSVGSASVAGPTLAFTRNSLKPPASTPAQRYHRCDE